MNLSVVYLSLAHVFLASEPLESMERVIELCGAYEMLAEVRDQAGYVLAYVEPDGSWHSGRQAVV